MYFILILILIAIDQITKIWAVNNLMGSEDIIVIENWFHLTYVENTGAAWGIMPNSKIFFIVLTLIIILGIVIYLLRERNNLDILSKLPFVIIVAGAIGNLIDRVRLGFVIDFIFTPLGGLYNFPVFNFADMYITLSAIFIIIHVLFFEDKNA